MSQESGKTKQHEAAVEAVNQGNSINETAENNGTPGKFKQPPLKKIILGSAGLAAMAVGAYAYMKPKPKEEQPEPPGSIELPDTPVEAQTVNDSMTLEEAFMAARTEVGATGFFSWHGKTYPTLTNEEILSLPPGKYQEHFANCMHADNPIPQPEEIPVEPKIEQIPVAIAIYDTAPQAKLVNDNMSFDEAFNVARGEVGPGGVYVWKGKEYQTYTNEEWNIMTAEMKQEFQESIKLDYIVPKEDGPEFPEIPGCTFVESSEWTDPETGEEGVVAIYKHNESGDNVGIAFFDREPTYMVVADNEGFYLANFEGKVFAAYNSKLEPIPFDNQSSTEQVVYPEVEEEAPYPQYNNSTDDDATGNGEVISPENPFENGDKISDADFDGSGVNSF